MINNKKEICLSVPAEPDFVMSLRLFVSGLGTVAGFDVDELEAMKLVISEMLVMSVKDEQKTVDFTFDLEDGELSLRANVTFDDRDDLSLKIMEALSDELTTNDVETVVIFKKEA